MRTYNARSLRPRRCVDCLDSFRLHTAGLLGVLQNPQQKLPVLIHSVDMHLFVGRVYALESRPERKHIHAGIALPNDSTLESGVNCLDLREFVVKVVIGVLGDCQDRGVKIGFPAGVPVAVIHNGTAELENYPHRLTDLGIFRCHGTALTGRHFHGFLRGGDGGNVSRCLHKSRYFGTHFDDTVRQRADSLQDFLLQGLFHDLSTLHSLLFHQGDRKLRIHLAKFRFDDLFARRNGFGGIGPGLLRNVESRRCLTGDCIVFVASRDRSQTNTKEGQAAEALW